MYRNAYPRWVYQNGTNLQSQTGTLLTFLTPSMCSLVCLHPDLQWECIHPTDGDTLCKKRKKEKKEEIKTTIQNCINVIIIIIIIIIIMMMMMIIVALKKSLAIIIPYGSTHTLIITAHLSLSVSIETTVINISIKSSKIRKLSSSGDYKAYTFSVSPSSASRRLSQSK